jgi:uncharacterized membrane protein
LHITPTGTSLLRRSRSAPALGGASTTALGWGVVPFGGYGYGYGGGYGYGAPAVATGGGIGFGEVLVLGVLAVIAFQVISSLNSGGNDTFAGVLRGPPLQS